MHYQTELSPPLHLPIGTEENHDQDIRCSCRHLNEYLPNTNMLSAYAYYGNHCLLPLTQRMYEKFTLTALRTSNLSYAGPYYFKINCGIET
jgi:hypothetical protein